MMKDTIRIDTPEQIVSLIKKYPQISFDIDNDCFFANLPNNDDFYISGDGCYGRPLLDALVILLNEKGYKITVENV